MVSLKYFLWGSALMPNFLHYTKRNLDEVLPILGGYIYTVLSELNIQAWRTPEPVPFAQRQTGEALELKPGDVWGSLFDCAWFHFTGQIPEAAAGKPVVLLLDVNGEMLVFDAQGTPVRGLTNGSSTFDFSLGQPGKRVLPVTESARGDEIIDVWADAGCNDLFGRLRGNGAVNQAAIAVCNETVRGLYYDWEVLLDLLKCLPEDSARHEQILTALNAALWKLAEGWDEPDFQAARDILRPMLEKRGGDPSLNISAIGHAHIDLGWLWPIRESHRKGGRTFATALANLERYPNYVFGASQPQLFQWVKDEYPTLYEKVKQRVKEGRFEPQGAMWVEADTNVSGGEALVRQILLGKRFFKKEFGVNINYLWLPDVFGYSAALPQILKKSGVDYFMTQKLSWNQVNHFPHQSFYWQGIDGSAVLTHMLPEETYNSPALPHSAVKIETNYQDKGVSDHALMLVGIGDGGGGPGEEHLERLERMRNLAGLSPITQEPAACFFERWVKDASRFETWSGELYLERHSGTLTTEAKNKWYNRRMEQGLRDLEWTAIYSGVAYPRARLEAIWREVLLYQFHDILPGSSIKRVYDESLARYRELYEEVDTAICQNEDCLAQQVDTRGSQNPVVVINTLSWPREEWIQARGHWQKVTVPALGYRAVDMQGETPATAPQASERSLENDLLRVQFAENGVITSIYDKAARREVLPEGETANRLVVYHDPGDAWDFPLDYRNQTPRPMRLVSTRASVDGPRAALVQTYCFGYSELTQEIVLTMGSRRLDFYTRTRWREREAMLRTSFPVAIQATEAAYEIQYGHIYRSTNQNTTWDLAKDEVAAHQWADLSERDYGVALLNDSKYGYRIKGNLIDLNLLRSVPYPGENTALTAEVPAGEPHPGYTDQADHIFNYALLPHPGDLVAGGVIQAAYGFNHPLHILPVDVHPGSRPQEDSFLTVDAPNVIVEAVKQAEDDDSVIVRLYESTHAAVEAQIHFGFPVSSVEETDLMEQPFRPVEVVNDAIHLALKPFEIKTIKIKK